MEKKHSEFGKGFMYNLILFAKHYEVTDAIGFWFDGAGDHLLELEIPKRFKNKKIGGLVKELQDYITARKLRLEVPEKDYGKVFEMLEELAMEIDKYFGVEPIKADWN